MFVSSMELTLQYILYMYRQYRLSCQERCQTIKLQVQISHRVDLGPYQNLRKDF